MAQSLLWKGWITANDLHNLLHCSFFHLYLEERWHVSDLVSPLKNYQSTQCFIDPSRISQFIHRIRRHEAIFNFVCEEFLQLVQEVVVQTCTVPSLMAILNVPCHSANMIHLPFPRSLWTGHTWIRDDLQQLVILEDELSMILHKAIAHHLALRN